MDPLPGWLQPFDENCRQRGDRVEVHEDMQDDDQERKGVVAQDRFLNPGLPIGRRFKSTN